MKILYLSYDGMTDPLGASQVLPYLKGLSQRGHRFSLISFEKSTADRRAWDRVRSLCTEVGIDWHPLRYHKRPPIGSTVWDVLAMRREAFRLHRQASFDLVHCRSYVPALVGLALKRRFGIRFLFDMRGFWPEERLEGAGWDRNLLLRAAYRYFKARERDFFREADAIVSLTNAGREQMLSRPADERPRADPQVIPCCVDLGHFKPADGPERDAVRGELGITGDAAVLCYLGSLGNNYLLGEMLRFFLALRERKSGAQFLFITREPAALIERAAAKHTIGAGELIIRAADRDEVPRLLSAADIGIAFKRNSFAEKACSPTKLAEMMAMGLPVVVNNGVGDVDQVIQDTGAGAVLDRFDRNTMLRAVDRLDSLTAPNEHIQMGAARWFSLGKGVQAYDTVYRSLGRNER